jgi:hypothetical protein
LKADLYSPARPRGTIEFSLSAARPTVIQEKGRFCQPNRWWAFVLWGCE